MRKNRWKKKRPMIRAVTADEGDGGGLYYREWPLEIPLRQLWRDMLVSERKKRKRKKNENTCPHFYMCAED